MPEVELRYPKLEEKEDFLRAMNENWQGWDFVFYWDSLAKGVYEDWIQYLPGFPGGRNLPKEHVPSTFLCAFNEKGQIVGRVSIRHELNEFLEREGGHIGYGVCPRFRRQGYATSILKETLSYIKKNLIHLPKVLITCDDDNVGSIKTIEKNGGVLQDKLEVSEGILKRRYWVNLEKEYEHFFVNKDKILKSYHQEGLKLRWSQSAFSDHFDLKRVGAHIFRIPPGYRSSEPHAEKLEEEFVCVISGQIDLWLNGSLKTMFEGDCIGFPAGTGIGHTFINNSSADCEIFVAGDRTKPDNQYYFHLNPSLKKECGSAWWDEVPKQKLGGHDGLPGDYDQSFYDESLPTFHGPSHLKESSFSYPGDSETFGDGLCLSRHFEMKSIAVWLERLMPGKRASWPHAHKIEEEFVYILKGEATIWLDGTEVMVKEETAVDFKAGSGIAHTIINNGSVPLYYLCVGECEAPGDQIFYPLHPKRNEEMKMRGNLWEIHGA